jgi:hypothetical protein
MIVNGFKCIKFYQVTYFDATPIVYNHLNKKTYSCHKKNRNNTKWRKKCLAIIRNKNFYIMKVITTSLMNEKTQLI